MTYREPAKYIIPKVPFRYKVFVFLKDLSKTMWNILCRIGNSIKNSYLIIAIAIFSVVSAYGAYDATVCAKKYEQEYEDILANHACFEYCEKNFPGKVLVSKPKSECIGIFSPEIKIDCYCKINNNVHNFSKEAKILAETKRNKSQN